jgi:hypothetical protein
MDYRPEILSMNVRGLNVLGIDNLYSIGAKGHIYIYMYRCVNMQETP